MSKIVVFTAIVGGYDDLQAPIVVNEDVRYVCFSDEPLEPKGVWQIVPIRRIHTDAQRSSRIYKLVPHRYFPDVDYSIWVDGNIEIAVDPVAAIENWLADHDIALFKHPERDCIYQEAEVCIQLGKDHPAVLREQIHKYRCEGYPAHNGLVATTVILRRHTSEIALLNERWWEEYVLHSCRDQISFNYVTPILGISYGYIPGNVFSNEHFRYKSHKKVNQEFSLGRDGHDHVESA